MKKYMQSVGTQVTAILLAAAGAAMLTFFQNLAASTGGICPIPSDPAEAGALGALLKGMHSAILAGRGTMNV